MSIKGAEYAVTRITATLQSYLPAELDLIDSEMADGIVLDDVADYYEHEAPASLIPSALCIVVDAKGSLPLTVTTLTNSPGIDNSDHRIEIRVDLKDTYNEEPQTTKKRLLRYARAVARLLTQRYSTLPLAGVETVEKTYRDEEMTYGKEEQGEGQFVRTATIPVKVRTYEQLV